MSFRGDDIIQVQHWTSDQTLPPSDSKINQHEERPIKSFSPQQGMIVALRITYQKLSSNSSDLVKLEPKLVYHRKIRIGPVAPRRRWRMFQLLLRRLRLRHKTSAWASGGRAGADFWRCAWAMARVTPSRPATPCSTITFSLDRA